jgi:hypothetical protein
LKGGIKAGIEGGIGGGIGREIGGGITEKCRLPGGEYTGES